MFKSRSFRLVNEEEARKRERLYEPKRIRWMKYIVIPALICFILLLILANVDFTGEAYDTKRPTTTTPATTTAGKTTTLFTTIETTMATTAVVTSTVPSEIASTTKLVKALSVVATIAANTKSKSAVNSFEKVITTHPTAAQSAERPVALKDYDTFTCEELVYCKSLICKGGPIYGIKDEIEYYANWCDGPFEILIENCTFNRGVIDEYTLSGFFKAEKLTIRNCTLNSISASAFKHNSMKSLTNLTLLQTQFNTLNEQTFDGLSVLKNFTLLNFEQLGQSLTAKGFLKPVSSTISTVMLQQLQQVQLFEGGVVRGGTVYNPADWLSGAEFTALLRVDMRGNNFGATLNSDTFSNLPQVQELILADCNINAIGEGTFDKVLQTLTLLDLSGNELHTLDGDLLATIALAGVHLELHDNAWHCDCDNVEFINLLITSELQMEIEPKCATPKEWEDVDIRQVELVNCDGDITTTTQTPSTTTITTTTAATTTTSTTTSTTASATSSSTSGETSSQTTLDTTETSDTTTTTATAGTTISTTETSTTNKDTTSTASKSSDSGESNITDETDETNETDETTWTTTSSSTSTTTPYTTIIPPATSTETVTYPPTTNTASVTYPPTLPPTPPSPFECSNKLGYIYCSTALTGVCDYDATFNVALMTSNSAVVHITESTSSVKFVYFSDTNSTELTTAESNKSSPIVINDLIYNCSYIFCLVPNGEHQISPFNCRSLFVSFPVPSAWLLKSSITLFFVLSGIGVIICVVVGLLAVYWLLRWRPVLMRGNKRLRRIDSTSKEMLLFPKTDRSSMDSKQQTFSELAKRRASVSDTLTPENCFNVKSYDYMQYYKNMELNRRKLTPADELLPPAQRAPALPPNVASKNSKSGSSSKHDGWDNGNSYIKTGGHVAAQPTRFQNKSPPINDDRVGREVKTNPHLQGNLYDNENVYESLDYYQEIY